LNEQIFEILYVKEFLERKVAARVMREVKKGSKAEKPVSR